MHQGKQPRGRLDPVVRLRRPHVSAVAVPGGNPVIAAPGLTPRSPLITVEPVLVTVEAPRTPKSPAVNKSIVA